uniref:Uncharacterized protein n=1 Tax=Corethron hystrix TaxID=216773 RepID=A0A7S1G2F7_9STRA|mmetsp:Transcript_6405/g.13852  ORF Transcript_6405/g.13852 Transcript_6405/m.13852 type:complete len:292 (+) Transcript_6405:116-991(+)
MSKSWAFQSVASIKRDLMMVRESTETPGAQGDERKEILKRRLENALNAKDFSLYGSGHGLSKNCDKISNNFDLRKLDANMTIYELKKRLELFGLKTITPGLVGRDRQQNLISRLKYALEEGIRSPVKNNQRPKDEPIGVGDNVISLREEAAEPRQKEIPSISSPPNVIKELKSENEALCTRGTRKEILASIKKETVQCKEKIRPEPSSNLQCNINTNESTKPRKQRTELEYRHAVLKRYKERLKKKNITRNDTVENKPQHIALSYSLPPKMLEERVISPDDLYSLPRAFRS